MVEENVRIFFLGFAHIFFLFLQLQLEKEIEEKEV